MSEHALECRSHSQNPISQGGEIQAGELVFENFCGKEGFSVANKINTSWVLPKKAEYWNRDLISLGQHSEERKLICLLVHGEGAAGKYGTHTGRCGNCQDRRVPRSH